MLSCWASSVQELCTTKRLPSKKISVTNTETQL